MVGWNLEATPLCCCQSHCWVPAWPFPWINRANPVGLFDSRGGQEGFGVRGVLLALGWTMVQLCGDSALWLLSQEPPVPPGRVGMQGGKAMELLDGFPNSGSNFPALSTNLHAPRWFFGASLVVGPPQGRSQTPRHRVLTCVTISPHTDFSEGSFHPPLPLEKETSSSHP